VKEKGTISQMIPSFQDKNFSNSGCAGFTGGAPKRETAGPEALKRIAFALARKFLEKWWDNCKVVPPPPAVFAPDIVEKLKAGALAADILFQLERLLTRHHMLAVDNGLTRRAWTWSGLLSDFRKLDFRSSPAGWYRQDRKVRSKIRIQIAQSLSSVGCFA
jgi:hypothetical protein